MSPLLKIYWIGTPVLGTIFAAIEDAGIEKIAGYGILTVILGWFMQVADKRLSGIEHALNGMRRTVLIDILARTSDSAVQRACKEELRKVDPNLASEFESKR